MNDPLRQKRQNSAVMSVWLLTAVLLIQSTRLQAADKWVAIDPEAVPNASMPYDGSAVDHPAPFTVPTVNGWLANAALTDLTVHFIAPEPVAAGVNVESADAPDYHFVITGPQFNERLFITQAGGPKKVRLVGERNLSSERPVLRLQRLGYIESWPLKQPAHDWLLQTYPAVTKPGAAYLEYFEMKDLVLDGDFDHQGAVASVANPAGYKGAALAVYSRTGLLDNLLVRRFGVVGEIPASYFSVAGVETFVVSFHTSANDKVSGDWAAGSRRFPWEVRGVNIEEFKSQHGGYTTLMMPIVFDAGPQPHSPAITFNDSPICGIHQCMVIGNQDTIAFGTAGNTVLAGSGGAAPSRLIAFEDNVVLNCSTALNTDTGEISWLTLRRNACLDILNGLRFGGGQHDYRIENNLFRLRGRANLPNYHNYNVTPTGMASDPTLPLGRPWRSSSAVLLLEGSSTGMLFQTNWITTWPSDQNLFYLPLLGSTPPATELNFRPIWSLPNGFVDELWANQSRGPTAFVTLKDNHLSPAGMEFQSGTISATPLNNFNLALATPAPAGQTYSAVYQDVRNPAPMTPALAGAFVPRGMISRVHPNFAAPSEGAPEQLVSVTEVVLGDCTLESTSSTSVTVGAKARVLDHRLPATGVNAASCAFCRQCAA